MSRAYQIGSSGDGTYSMHRVQLLRLGEFGSLEEAEACVAHHKACDAQAAMIEKRRKTG